MKLDWYFARRFFWTFSGVFTVFLLILSFLGIVEQVRQFSGSEATFSQTLTLAALNIPQAIYGILPLVMIVATIALFLGLSRSSEMVVTRAAGRGALRAMVPPLMVSLIIGLLSIAILNPIVAATSRQYEIQSDELKGQSSVLAIGATGLWLRQGNETGQTVIHADSANLNGTLLRDVTFTTFSPNGLPTRRIAAQQARLTSGAWELDKVKSWPLVRDAVPEAAATVHESLTVPSTLTPDQIRDSFGTPSSIPIWELPNFIKRLQTAGFSAQRHQVWLHMELSLPVFLMSMVLVGAAFTLRHQRGGRTGLMVLLAILISFGMYFLRNFTQILGENGQLPVLLAAWIPPLASIGLSMGLLLHNEDG